MSLSLSHASLYKGLAIGLLVSWTLTALSYTALVALNTNSTYLEIIACTTMFTFLMCRLLVAWNPSPKSENITIAQLIASADSGSCRGALVLFSLCCTWLYELLNQALVLFFMTVFGGVIATAIYNDAFTDGVQETEPHNGSTTSLSVHVKEFKETVGFDPTELFKMIPPRVLLCFVGLMWLNFLSLGAYVLGHAVVSLKKVLSSPTSTSTTTESTVDKAVAVASSE
ncbi:uncharacterized protein NFIA_044040 [Aspergillus fischeri NRRL 181]|uniref:Uncharacterized protein n=1 Tax=Neosartorya fischeri (strain ATCC 1020 / DSM 3700 / CBS 544.65 / FGSC A1164 / JCM 1740 / NRRL 181 / WB 181) TaxID=331117 RepID=A1CV08_NEOFI|nr:conserved hypothetical protein [Aspergillus fischeri NRRL 181]EAW25585.1 conserved hypothetical protein [Aspergillus fischeri NRRL 181]KAG2002764.1 hypothetical protein GB937_009530 [Aspergillus fischeri]